jgi:hypothetical protein
MRGSAGALQGQKTTVGMHLDEIPTRFVFHENALVTIANNPGWRTLIKQKGVIPFIDARMSIR